MIQGDVHDFDFLVGRWDIANRRLKRRFANSNRWDEFPATSSCEQRLGGIMNVDELVFPTQGFSGATVRVFDLSKRRWSIYWVNTRTGVLFPPVQGGFAGSRGEFYGDDEDEGRPVKVQFLWTVLDSNRARWEQAFSLDDRNWETNWIMELTRSAGAGRGAL